MFIIIWQYRVSPDKIDEFIETYKSGGKWSKFFGQSDSYISSKLYKSSFDNFIVIDSWKSKNVYNSFKKKYSAEYKDLSENCSQLYDIETKVGEFEEVIGN